MDSSFGSRPSSTCSTHLPDNRCIRQGFEQVLGVEQIAYRWCPSRMVPVALSAMRGFVKPSHFKVISRSFSMFFGLISSCALSHSRDKPHIIFTPRHTLPKNLQDNALSCMNTQGWMSDMEPARNGGVALSPSSLQWFNIYLVIDRSHRLVRENDAYVWIVGGAYATQCWAPGSSNLILQRP